MTDFRIEALAARVPLAGKHVVELGCYHGALTMELSALCGRVTAIEGREENLAQAKMRAYPNDAKVEFVLANVENINCPWVDADVYFNSGVLYHLADPITNLYDCFRHAREAVLLDTHYAASTDTTYRSFDVRTYNEPEGAKSGLGPVSFWLQKADLLYLTKRWWKKVEVVSDRVERNGPRITIIATEKA